MKTTVFLASLLFSAFLSAQDGYQFFLDQRNLEGDGFIRTSITQEDSMQSPMPVPEGGSEFTVWAVNTPTVGAEEVWTHIGNQIVGAYLPQASIQIITNDPYAGGIPRTRIDQPFTVNYTVSGLDSTNPEAPPSAMQVLFDRRASKTILTDQILEPDANVTPELVSQDTIDENGSDSTVYFSSLLDEDPDADSEENLPVDLLTTSGIETFTINAFPDGTIASLELAKAQVQVWPLPGATFIGIDNNAKYAAVPAFQVQLTKVYPQSQTYLQIYPGVSAPGTVGTRVGGSILAWNSTKTRDGILSFPSIANYLQAEGLYTVEVITVTPFGQDIVESLTFDFDNTISIRGNFNFVD